MTDESRSPQRGPRPLAWVALTVSTVFTVLVWWSGTEQGTALAYGWFLNDFIPEVVFFALLLIVAVILNIAASRRGRANRIIALIAFLIVLLPVAVGVIAFYQTA